LKPTSWLASVLCAQIALLLSWDAVMAQTVGDKSVTGGDKVAQGAILVKGAWSSASDDVTPLPEGGRVADGTYSNDYFGLSYSLSGEWTQRYSGPPPSDSGYFVLAQLEPTTEMASSMPGHILVAAQDLFFSLMPALNAREQIAYTSSHLAANYTVETPPTEVRIANHSFVRFDYVAPVSGLHWRILATQTRCHVVQFIFTARDPKLLDRLSGAMSTMTLPLDAGATTGTGGGAEPVCIKDYASSPQRIAGENPIFSEQRFNPVPVRIIIDTEGRIRHIHFLSAFPGQSRSISDALTGWRFKPYLVNGHPVEVETGIMFGRAPRAIGSPEA
jgi:hypothetical protein